MRELAGYVDGLPNLGGSEQRIWAAIAAGWGSGALVTKF
jgi:hypothetical protein